jgi:carboxymethylenebutenolidase
MRTSPNTYLYENIKYSASEKSIIVLPEIFGLTKGIRDITDRLAEEFKCLTFAVDYYFGLTGKPTKLDVSHVAEAIQLKEKMNGQVFMNVFDSTLDYIINQFPHTTQIIVIGFCFGGRLAWMSGANPNVSKIISFYGAEVDKPFHLGKTVLEYLIKVRAQDPTLKTLALFGKDDQSIPKTDRQSIQDQLHMAGIDHRQKEYQAGHSFFNPDRSSFNQSAAEQAMNDLRNFIQS